jgi:L-asparaginase
MKVSFLTTGGTIDKVYFDEESEYKVGSSNIDSVLKTMNVAFEYQCKSIISKDSLQLNRADRQKIVNRAKREPCEKIIITHGTDTIVKTMKALSKAQIPKTIILTGAFKPYLFRDSDAIFNLATAIGAIQAIDWDGVFVAMNGMVFNEFEDFQKNKKKKRFECM